MEPVYGAVAEAFSLTLDQVSTLSVLQAFVLAAGILVALVLLAAAATLAGRWLSHSIDQVFEWLLLLALGAALGYVFFGGYLRLP